jgi:hypothetical protein
VAVERAIVTVQRGTSDDPFGANLREKNRHLTLALRQK